MRLLRKCIRSHQRTRYAPTQIPMTPTKITAATPPQFPHISGLNRARFWVKVDKSPHPKGCWIWTGATKKSKAVRYGNFSVSGRTISAHRASYAIAHGGCADPRQVLHSCDNPLCVNPAHLSLGTNHDNVSDMVSKGRHKNQLKTHCPNGHPLSGDNLWTSPSRPNWRYCKTCRQNRKRKSP